MSQPQQQFPYATFLDIKFPALELVGHFIIALEDRSVDLQPRQGFVVPKGVVHRTRAPHPAVILMVETAAIVPTGD